MFADDLLIAFHANPKSCSNVLKVLGIFQMLTNLQSQLPQIQHLLLQVCVTCLQTLGCNSLGIRERHQPIKYLGSYLSLGYFPLSFQNVMVDKALSRVQGQYKGFNFQARKMVLINSMINSTQSHLIFNCNISDSILNHMTHIARNFFWNSNPSSHMKLISWDTISKPKDCEGLGLCDLLTVNKSICAKQILSILNKSYTLWVHILTTKYGGTSPLD